MKGRGGLRGNIPEVRKKIIVEVVLAPPGTWAEGGCPGNEDVTYHEMKALVDTGATISCITKQAVKELNLSPRQDTEIFVKTAGGETKLCDVYDVDMGIKLPSGQLIPFSETPLAETRDEGDMILGMNIITQGSLNIEGMEFHLHFNQQPLPFTNPNRAT